MCNMQLLGSRILTVLVGYLVAETKAYPMQSWPVYPQSPREYQEDDYYYSPKVQYYYDAPALPANTPDVYGQPPNLYSYDTYDPYSHFSNEAAKSQEERYSALPIGQETWFESEPSPWRSNDIDDVSATFLDNLILTQMAQDAHRRRENARAAFPPVDYDGRDSEDEDVRELKALAGKPLYHVPKTVPRIEEDDYAEDGFINWDGYKRSVTTVAPLVATTTKPTQGQKEEVISRPAPATTDRMFLDHPPRQDRAKVFEALYRIVAKEKAKVAHDQETKGRKIEKRFVASDSDLVMELRGLKHRIRT